MLMTTLALAALSLSPNEVITWFGGSYEEAVQSAISNDKHMMVYFWANTDNCARLYEETMQDEGVVESMSELVCYSANAGEDAGRALLDSFHLQTVPAILVLSPEGEEEEMLTGFMSASTFQAEMNRIKNGINTLGDLRKRAKARHRNCEDEYTVLQMLSNKLAAVGESDEAEEIVEKMLRKDSRATTSVVSQLLFSRLYNEMVENLEDDDDVWDIAPLEKFVHSIPRKNKKGRYLGLISLGDLYQQTERMPEALDAYAGAWKERLNDFASMNTGYGLLGRLDGLGEDLDEKYKHLAVEIASELHGMILSSHAERCQECDGSRDDCQVYLDDAQAIQDGQSTGHFVTDRPLQGMPFAQYWLAKSHWRAGDRERAVSLMRRASTTTPDSQVFADELAAMVEAH